MSADNYRNCPKCGVHGAREDYEIYSEYEDVIIYYSISCASCGYRHKIERSEEMPNLAIKETI